MKFDELPYWGQLLLIAGLCLGLGFVFFQFLYKPVKQEVTTMERQLSENRQEILRLRPYENRVPDLERQLAEIKENLLQLEAVFPSTKDDVEVKRFVENVAAEFDIDINSYRAGSNVEADDYIERQVNLRTTGRTQDYLRFFNALAKRSQVIHIYGLSMARQTRGDAATLSRYPVSSDLSISSYVYIPVDYDGGTND